LTFSATVYARSVAKPFGELALIEQIRSGQIRAAQTPGAGKRTRPGSNKARDLVLGIGDDCAILRPPRGHQVLVTTDLSLEGRHFRRDLHPPESAGHRVLARGLSDLAAMGARPLAAFLSLALPAQMLATRQGREWIARFFAGLNALAAQHSVPLAGGDTSESPMHHGHAPILADIVLVGSAPAGRALRRSGARAGDALYVTGHLGGSAAELALLQQHALSHKELAALRHPSPPADPNPHPQLFPQPRLAVGLALLRRRLATAAIDLSDGLSTDLAHLCSESRLGAEISAAALPIHPLALQLAAARARVSNSARFANPLHSGEDYELLFAAPPAARMPRSVGAGNAGVRITRIGTLTRGKAITLVDSSGQRAPLQPGGWEHFRSKR
jgi:thiamine-monophosphate kinase